MHLIENLFLEEKYRLKHHKNTFQSVTQFTQAIYRQQIRLLTRARIEANAK